MQKIIDSAKKTIEIEAKEIMALASKIDESFAGAINAVLASKGRLIVSGMGKSGLIGHKIAATLASTGTPSFFLHPAEAYHGDLGMIRGEDVVLLLSNSGETDEVLKIVPFLQDQQNVIVAMTGNKNSSLAKAANFHLDCAVETEACPWQLAPTSSTTAALVMGDALAVALMEARSFKPEEFARFHPGGSLGRKLLSRAKHELVSLEKLPLISGDLDALSTISAITSGKLGVAIVLDGKKLVGIVTDGDIRRAVEANKERFFELRASQMMTQNPKTIDPETRIIDAEELMDNLKIHQLVVADKNGEFVGILPYRRKN